MFLFILIIFINSIYINTASDDESTLNKYINLLPAKEKKEFLERVARRILEEVKSGEGGPDLVSGEIPDEQLKVHSDYVNRLLKEETENLKRRHHANEKKNNDTTSLKIDTVKNTETEKKIQDIKGTVDKIQNVDKNVDNQAESRLRTDDKEIIQDQEKNKNTKDDISQVIDLTLREGVEGKEKTPELEKKQDIDISETQEKSQSANNDQTHHDNTDKATYLTLGNNDGLDEDKIQNEEKHDNQRIDLTPRNNIKADNNSSIKISNEKDKNHESDQNLTSLKHTNKPVSIEITFVNDGDYKETSEKSKVVEKDEIPVKVVYDEDKPEEPEKNIQDVTITNIDAETIDPITNGNVNKESNTNDKKLKTFRKSLSESKDDHVENQIARKKRKSRTDIDSTETSTNTTNIEEFQINDSQNSKNNAESGNNIEVQAGNNFKMATTTETSTNTTNIEVSQINDSQDSNNNAEIGKNTAVQASNNLKMASAPSYDINYNMTLGIETVNGSSNIDNSSPSTILVIDNDTENITRASLDNEPESTTEKVEIRNTEKVGIQHTQMNDFDANENETIYDLDVTTTNHTENTTEEIVKMRTQYVSGYPEDSYENSTSKTEDVINTKPEKTTANPNKSIHIEKATSRLHESSSALKLSGKENAHDNIDNVANVSNQEKKVEDLSYNTSNAKNVNPQLRASSKDSNKEEDKVKSDLVKSKPEPQDKEQQNLKSKIPVTKDPVLQHVTSTMAVPLTTTENNNKKELYYAVEASVEILNDSLIALNNHNDAKEKLQKKMLRKGLSPDKDTQEDFSLIKNKPEKKEYLVYELLPGQQPFEKKQSKKKRSKKLNPKSYPKFSKYVSKQEKISYGGLTSQIEQPTYAPVYNYAPEYAYYNPKNKYGPNSNDEEVKIVDERSNEFESDDVEKIFDYDIPKRVKNTKHRHGARSARPIIIELTNENRFKDNRENKISEDYYLGFLDRYTNNKKGLLRLSDKCKGKKCKEPYVTVVQDPVVPPNSDEPHHAHNALLNYNPPVTHTRQVENILGGLKYYHHNHNHIHDYKCKHNVSYFHGSGETWVSPDLDLFFAKKISKGRFIRSGGDRSNEPNKSDKRFGQSFKIPNHLKLENKKHLEKLNETFHKDKNHKLSPNYVHKKSKKGPLKKRPMYLLTGGHKPTHKYTDKKRSLYLLTGVCDHKRPMLLLTGGIGKNAKKEDGKHTLLLLTGNNKNFELKLKNKRKKEENIISDVSSAEEYKISKENYDFEDVARTKPKDKSSETAEYHSDPADTSSGELDTFKDLNLDVISLIINMSDNHRDPKYQLRLLAKYMKQGKLYSPPKKPKEHEYGKLLNKLPISRSGSRNLEVYVSVMKDMIEQDSKALKQYDWLSSTVDIRSALNKLSQLSNSIQKNSNVIHPKDLQLVKYILYLYSTTKHIIEEANKVEITSAKEFPSNKRFAYAEKESAENPRFLVEFTEYKPVQRRNRIPARRFLERPWLRNNGLKGKMGDLNILIEGLGHALDDLHDAIKHIAVVTNYRSQRWFENLKELYLKTPPSRKQALEIILHIATIRLISLIEESAANGLDSNYVRYGLSNPEQVQRTREAFAFVVDVYLALNKLQ